MASSRDPVTGRFVSTANTRESGEGKFPTYANGLPVEIQGDDPADLAYGTERRHAPAADDLAQGGQSSPLRARRPEMVPAEDAAHETSSRQGAVLRAAARGSGPMDPTSYLTGAE
jgi:hypothetical protein